MRILVTGNGRFASWTIRGRQLGAAIGATVREDASLPLIRMHDVVVLVKHPGPALLERLHQARACVVWDVVDAWPQPEGNGWGEAASIAWLCDAVKRIAPQALVGATQHMAADARRCFDGPVCCVPHHAREGQPVATTRNTLARVGYEGHCKQLGRWGAIVADECRRRGWQFVHNPATLSEVDVLVALRDADGHAARHWKSNVKLANAQRCGVPIVCNRESGYLETASGAECWADEPAELHEAFDRLEDAGTRRDAARRLRRATPLLPDVAGRYRRWLASVSR